MPTHLPLAGSRNKIRGESAFLQFLPAAGVAKGSTSRISGNFSRLHVTETRGNSVWGNPATHRSRGQKIAAWPWPPLPPITGGIAPVQPPRASPTLETFPIGRPSKGPQTPSEFPNLDESSGAFVFHFPHGGK